MIWALLFLVLVPLLLLILKGGREDDKEADPVAHYRRQLVELEDDFKRGVLSKAAAASARLEIERRILRLADHQKGQGETVRSGYVAPVTVSVFLILGSFLMYWLLGSPAAQSKFGQVVNNLDAPVSKDGPSYREAIDQITGHLADNPDDKQGWEVLAKSARAVRSFSVAANAFGELVRLDTVNTNWRVQQLEAYIAMARGQVTPAANMLVQELLKQEPNHPAGHYYMGLARLQSRDTEGAKAIWMALADRSPSNAPWMPTVRERLSELGVQPPQLSPDQMDMVAGMSGEEQDAFVRSMIERLEARLESAQEDAEGWMMLARSQAALGEKDTAIATLTRAMDLVSAEKRPQLKAFLDNLVESPNP